MKSKLCRNRIELNQTMPRTCFSCALICLRLAAVAKCALRRDCARRSEGSSARKCLLCASFYLRPASAASAPYNGGALVASVRRHVGGPSVREPVCGLHRQQSASHNGIPTVVAVRRHGYVFSVLQSVRALRRQQSAPHNGIAPVVVLRHGSVASMRQTVCGRIGGKSCLTMRGHPLCLSTAMDVSPPRANLSVSYISSKCAP